MPEVFKGRIRRSQELEAGPRLEAKLVEILRVAHIQRAQQERVQYSEDDDVCADPKRQGDQSHQRERTRLPEHAQRMTEIHQQVWHVTGLRSRSAQE